VLRFSPVRIPSQKLVQGMESIAAVFGKPHRRLQLSSATGIAVKKILAPG
jgi:hypothetical protein